MKVTLMALAGLLAVASFSSCDNDDDNNTSMLNFTDSSFVMMAGMSNTAEIRTSMLADSVSTDTSIQHFAEMMIADHTTAQSELKTIAARYGVMPPDSVNAAHAALMVQLMALSGRAFDSVYIHNQVIDHEATIQLFQTEVNNGSNADLRNFASAKLPALQMHLAHADSLAAGY